MSKRSVTTLSSKRNSPDARPDVPSPSPYYTTRVRRALELLVEAAVDDLEYAGDMLSEGIREGAMTQAVRAVEYVLDLATEGDKARLKHQAK